MQVPVVQLPRSPLFWLTSTEPLPEIVIDTVTASTAAATRAASTNSAKRFIVVSLMPCWGAA
ncbi:MAG: hypothetical protein ABR961_03405 [Thermoanaerobaculaceae bacterium]